MKNKTNYNSIFRNQQLLQFQYSSRDGADLKLIFYDKYPKYLYDGTEPKNKVTNTIKKTLFVPINCYEHKMLT